MTLAVDNIPDLTSKPVWLNGLGPEGFMDKLKEAYPKIREEILGLRGQKVFQPYRDPKPDYGTVSTKDNIDSSNDDIHNDDEENLGVSGTSSGNWNVLYLYLNHKKFPICDQLPETIRAIEKIFPRHYSHAFVSALTPGTNIIPHFGPSNRMLRVWLPLDGCEGKIVGDNCSGNDSSYSWTEERTSEAEGGLLSAGNADSNGMRIFEFQKNDSFESEETATNQPEFSPLFRPFPIALQVHNKIVVPKNGIPFAWDHSYRHSAWNFSSSSDHSENGQSIPSSTRLVLIVDIWHPDLSQEEVTFLNALQKAKLKAARKLVEETEAAQAECQGDPNNDVKLSATDRKNLQNNLISLVERTKGLLHDDDWWVIRAEREAVRQSSEMNSLNGQTESE